jgi:lysozyme family protein
MLSRFQEIFKHTLKWEGGDKLHNIAGDSGGWTKYGIAYNHNQIHFDSLEEFKQMDYDTACGIAYQDYCIPIRLDLVNKEAQAMLFDISYNAGARTAIKLAQRALKLTDDGILGKKTKEALKWLDKNELYLQRVNYYKAIVKNKTSQNKFLKGWLNRSKYFLQTEI